MPVNFGGFVPRRLNQWACDSWWAAGAMTMAFVQAEFLFYGWKMGHPQNMRDPHRFVWNFKYDGH